MSKKTTEQVSPKTRNLLTIFSGVVFVACLLQLAVGLGSLVLNLYAGLLIVVLGGMTLWIEIDFVRSFYKKRKSLFHFVLRYIFVFMTFIFDLLLFYFLRNISCTDGCSADDGVVASGIGIVVILVMIAGTYWSTRTHQIYTRLED